MAWLLMAVMVSGPNSHRVTMPDRPSRASRNGAVDIADQKAACELIPNSESDQALLRVRPTTLRQRFAPARRPSAPGRFRPGARGR